MGPQQPGAATTLGWLKPWRPRDVLYPALPFQTIACQAVPYTPPAAGERITEPLNVSLGDGSVRFLNSGGALDGTSNTLFISERNQVTVTQPGNPLGCAIKIDPKTGTFSGKIRAPGSSQFTLFYGVFHQGAYGYGLGFSPAANAPARWSSTTSEPSLPQFATNPPPRKRRWAVVMGQLCSNHAPPSRPRPAAHHRLSPS